MKCHEADHDTWAAATTEDRRRVNQYHLPGQPMTHSGRAAPGTPLMDGRTVSKSMKMSSKMTSGLTRTQQRILSNGSRYLELEEQEEELEASRRKDVKSLSAEDEALLDDLFIQAQQESMRDLMAFIEVTVLISPDQALGLHLDGVPVTAAAAWEIPLSTQVTKIEPHGLLQIWSQPDQLVVDENASLRLARVDGREGLDGVSYLKSIFQTYKMRQTGDPSETLKVNLTFCREAKFKFNFKQRQCVGTALHVAVLHRNGFGLLRRLLQQKADPEQEFYYRSRGDPAFAPAIHLAAARDLIRHISLLIEHRASVHAVSKVNNENNFTALHEAASYGLQRSALCLLRARADPNATNLKMHTPLHCAARQGDTRMCLLLKNHGADLKAKDVNEATPVIVAVERGRFRFDKLFILMEKSFEDLLVVSRLCASVGPEVMRDNSTNEVHHSWREALVKEASEKPVRAAEHWMEIMNNSAGAGEDILDALTVLPQAQSDAFNPVPRRARLPLGKDMLCCYERTSEWKYDTESAVWQSKLCPGIKSGWVTRGSGPASNRAFENLLGYFKRGGGPSERNLSASTVRATEYLKQEATRSESTELVPVKVRQLKLPGIINPDVMDILAFTVNHNVLRKPTGQAIILFAWDHVARYYYLTYVFYQVIIIGSLVAEVASPPETLWGSRVRWSLLAVLAVLELFYEFWEMCGFFCYLQQGWWRYILNPENYYNWTSIGLLIALVCLTYNDHSGLQEMPIWLSIVVLARWIQLTWSCRAFGLVGQKILPIMQASVSAHIGGIMFVTLCVLFGFMNGAMALELGSETPHHKSVVMGALKLLLLGDGDGIDATLSLGGAQDEDILTALFVFVAMVVFCVCVLNLFIAVHGEAYDSAQEKAFTSFLQERAGICLHCLLRPSWPPRCLKWRVPHRIRTYVFLQLASIAAWLLLLREETINVLIPTALLWGSAMLGHAILVQRPWIKSKEAEYYLWMCYKESFDQANLIAADRDATDSMDGKISRLKRDNKNLFKQVTTEINSISRHISEQNQVLNQKVQGMDSRLQGLESLIEDLHTSIQHIANARVQESPHLLE